MATRPDYPLLTADEFLQIDFGDRRAELDNGVIRMMAGGSARHARIAFDIMLALGNRLRGTECTPYNADMAASTGTSRTDLRVRLPEYEALPSVNTIVFVDTATERVRVVQRTAARRWDDDEHDDPCDVLLPSLNVVLPHDEIFARD